MTQQQTQPDKSEIRIRLENLPNEAVIKAGGHTFVKEGSLHLRTSSGVLTVLDFTKHFSDFDLIDEEYK